ncbi:haloacid dehalogenase-like hydrolase-domain-containing protein [Amylostereum chailletii]|nr:haloacid dehalogenase-like hydrolase-domain-containing protein [Amylostereum chailletii]
MAVGMAVRNQSSNTPGIATLRYAISVMVIFCPCALVLCVPMVVVIATGVAGKAGVLFKSAQAVQYAKDVRIAIFDKTGTLTTGTLEVVEAHIPSDESIATVLGLVAASRHPVAQAMFKHLSALHPTLSPRQFKDVQSVAGQGMEARASDQIIRGGNPTWLGLEAHPVVSKMQGAALTMFTVTPNASLVAAFGLSDTVRPSARSAIEYLTAQGCAVYIVSGDAQPVVSALAMQLAIPPSHAFGGCLPQTELGHVRTLPPWTTLPAPCAPSSPYCAASGSTSLGLSCATRSRAARGRVRWPILRGAYGY